MLPAVRSRRAVLLAVAAAALGLSGCTGVGEYFRNGLKVGPNYCPPEAPVAPQWIDAADTRLRGQSDDLSRWWTVFNDPVLNRLIVHACQQNLSLREAGFRVLQARAQLGIAIGEIFPQAQNAVGSYSRLGASLNPPVSGPAIGKRFTDQWNFGFNLAWEIDFWGRFRRAIAAADDLLDASVADYDQVMVTLLGDVASNYVRVRTDQRRIELLRDNAKLQQGVLTFIKTRLEAGFKVTKLDVAQAESNLAQTEAAIPQLQIDLRQAANRLCVLLGMPPADLEGVLGTGAIPTTPPEVAVGIPADLLRQRPDVRRAERLAAAQCEQIGIAQSDLYPIFTINGTLGWQAKDFPKLFTSQAFKGSVGPSFQWNILNYGRIRNNVRLQEAAFQELVVAYQNAVLVACEEVEDGIVTFLRSQERTKLLEKSVAAAEVAVQTVVLQWEKGAADFNRYAVIEQNKVTQQDLLAQAQGQIAQGLIQVYRALGGGWETGPGPEEVVQGMPAAEPLSGLGPAEEVAAPQAPAPQTAKPPVEPPGKADGIPAPPAAPEPPAKRP